MLRRSLYIIFLLCLHSYSYGQLCEGNLGENIFTQGDFGSGTQNIPTTDPGIAPGYTYSTNPPPNDGSYCLTNDITVWNQVWGWANIGDNSNDPQGYMMVVNASYDTGLFYEQVIDGLCENTIYEFSADVRNLHFGAGIILPNVSFLIDDVIEYESGNVPENNQWNNYGFTFTTAIGQTEVKLSLANNAPGGIGNDLAIDNITFRACGPEALILPTEVANICEDGNSVLLDATINGEQYDDPHVQWQQSFDGGMTWVDLVGENDLIFTFDNLSGGTYYYRYKLANAAENLLNNKCRVISNTKVVEVIPKFTSIVDSLCQGLELNVGNSAYSNTGIYVDSLLNILGCDSIVTADLTIVPDQNIGVDYSIVEPICSNTADGTIVIDDIINGVGPFEILFEETALFNPYLIEFLQPGDYRYQVIDRYGCTFDDLLELTGPDPFILDLGENQVVDLGDMVQVSAETNMNTDVYTWITSETLPCILDCTEQNWSPTSSHWIEVTAVSDKDCIDRDSVFIEVREVRKIYIPNTFSPNGDNINDDFIIHPISPNVQSIARAEIYDRWGNKVYELGGEEFVSWDGNTKGRAVISGIYSYIIEAVFLDGKSILYKGEITLVR